MSERFKVLVVCHCYRDGETLIRIILARKADRHEIKQYESIYKMRKEYDFSKSKKNPYAKHLKQQVTILLDREAVAYFKKMAMQTGVAYQVLINLYLKECAQKKKQLSFESKTKSPRKVAA